MRRYGRLATLLLIPLVVAGCNATTPTRSASSPASVNPTPAVTSSAVFTAPDTGSPFTTAPAFARDSQSSIWPRLRRGYGLGDHTDLPEVRTHMNWYIQRPDFLERVTGRGEPYIHYIVSEVERRGLPAELALLPIVESAFQPFAYSHGRASGIWQFIPSTGSHFGLKQSWWYDGRRDVHASTQAALDYLMRLHQQFDGDWLLAIAAYNCGEGTVARAVRNNAAAGRPTDFWNLDLPPETRGYVPRLLAVSALVAAPSRYDIRLWPVKNEPMIEVVDLDGQIDLAVAARLADIELDTLYVLNPGFNRWATDPDGPHRLLLPKEKVAAFRTGLAELPTEERVTWRRHQIAKGDTISGIAKRYGTTVAVLREVNKLSGNNIRAGQHLLVPTASKSASAYNLSADRRRDARQASAPAQGSGTQRHHTIKAGDTFWEIAKRYNVGVRELARWNGMAPGDPLRIGDRLVIWSKAPETVSTAPSLAAPPNTLRTVNYAVRSGDSLWSISRRFRVTVADIRRWNGLPEKVTLRPGQRLKLEVDVTAQDG